MIELRFAKINSQQRCFQDCPDPKQTIEMDSNLCKGQGVGPDPDRTGRSANVLLWFLIQVVKQCVIFLAVERKELLYQLDPETVALSRQIGRGSVCHHQKRESGTRMPRVH